ncbi:MAG: hypothetical protein F4W68_01450 [Cenarchaeum sp. SB0661_bin_35]|nr:hypothetical protein [Cenarchaeum sp. SB0667_bin_13]MYC79157.1 hypothetical protein [Cenarchaeum sp. SB0661_bin_35]
MEIKTHALLLSLLVIAGAVTIDAYAQTNTQRIATIEDNTNDISSVVDAINSMVSGMADAIDDITAGIVGLQSAVTSVDDSVSEVKDSVDSLSGEISTIKSSITGFDDVMASISLMNDRISSIEDRLSSIEVNVISNQGSGGADSAVLQALAERVAQIGLNMESINNQLSAISDEVGVIRTTSTTPSTPSPTGYFEGTTQKIITNYDYKQLGNVGGKDGSEYYDLDMTFTCTGDVFLDTADMVEYQGEDTQYLSRLPDTAADDADLDNRLKGLKEVNFINVDGRTLYSSSLNIGNDNYVQVDTVETFENRRLAAGDGLKFETRIYDGQFTNGTTAADTASDLTTGILIFGVNPSILLKTGDVDPLAEGHPLSSIDHLIANATKNNRDNDELEIKLYTIVVNWNTFNAASCSIGIGGSTTAIGANTPGTAVVGVKTGEGIIKDYEAVLDCGGSPLTITKITTSSGSDGKNISQFGHLDVTILDGNNEDTADVQYGFVTDSWDLELKEDSPNRLNLSVSGHDVRIDGETPADGLIIQIDYMSVPGAVCTFEDQNNY